MHAWRRRSTPGATFAIVHSAVPSTPSSLSWSVPVGKKLYVGNLSYDIGNSDLQRAFAAHGTVVSAQVITERETGRSTGFGFVEMASEQEAQAAINALNGTKLAGRNLTVNEARQQESRGGGNRGDGGGGYGGGGYGGGGGRGGGDRGGGRGDHY